MKEMIINSLPVPTWRWLKVNEKYIKLSDKMHPVKYPDAYEIISGDGDGKFDDIEMGMGEDIASFARSISGDKMRITKQQGDKDAKYCIIKLAEADDYAAGIELYAGEGSVLNVFLDYSGLGSATGVSDIRVIAEDNAVVKLVEVFHFDKDAVFYDNIGARLGKKAEFNLKQLVISGEDINLGVCTELAGDYSLLNSDLGYLRSGSSKLDINYVARQKGKLTESHMLASGVLRDEADKIFRGSIDFIHGCADSKGEEREDVLLLSPDVRNRTVPLILCAEENVEGEHGASIGKLSEEELFYFESRGIPEKTVNELMAASKLEAVAGRIDDMEIKSSVMSLLCKKKDI